MVKLQLFFWVTTAGTLECRAEISVEDAVVSVGPILVPAEIIMRGDDAIVSWVQEEIPKLIQEVIRKISQGEEGKNPSPISLEVIASRLNRRFQ